MRLGDNNYRSDHKWMYHMIWSHFHAEVRVLVVKLVGDRLQQRPEEGFILDA